MYNNRLLTEQMKAAYAKLDEMEIARVRAELESGDDVREADTGPLVCYTTNGACTGLRRCALTAKKTITVPGMEDDRPVGYCFERDVLFDALLTESAPANPYNGEALPEVFVRSLGKKYMAELLMRAYYLETIAAEEAGGEDEASSEPESVTSEEAEAEEDLEAVEEELSEVDDDLEG